MLRGRAVAGRFEIEERRGAGGMAAVYKARDRETGGLVALKVLNVDNELKDSFRREALALASLDHPAIVRCIGSGAVDASTSYLAIEWLDGEDLSERLARSELSFEESLALMARVAEGLAYAHARGVVHRDVKPANIFLPGGEVSGGARHHRARRHALGGRAERGVARSRAPQPARSAALHPRARPARSARALSELVVGA